ncbi:uncharacterized protein KY384_001887 [Bacidia gigantensis]|uniref:uncharacterized protein n=1 Tax=Bacidia gigantensis TaxID=2732470 RepID=UPI001D03D786|nr:uncharacterized protein KY384_001887 [Bacidia gigantensis]KAG8533104.1 hypothetical protein KY384_001887 [Bacidia gigantensis]
MVTRSVPAKRKQAADMAESPPKRVTRARAAKAPVEAEVQTTTTKTEIASTKSSTTKKKAAAAPTKTTKRKTRAEDEENEMVDLQAEQAKNETLPVIQPKEESAKPRGSRQRKIAKPEESSNVAEEAPKPKGRQVRTPMSQAKDDTTKTRARPRRGATAVDQEINTVTQTSEAAAEPAPLKKTTRGRAAAAATSKTETAKATSKKTVTKKKVQFQDEPDKENVPIEPEGPKKSAMKITGLKAKPIRKPAATKATARGKKTAQKGSSDTVPNSSADLPLSPKKVTQVAKTPSTSEDELAVDNTPVRALSRSPVKVKTSPLKAITSPSKQASTQITVPVSPSKLFDASAISSPAKRFPQSPFKDSMKSSPKKFNFADTIAKPKFSGSQATSPVKTSLLLESPRKVKIPEIGSSQIVMPSQTPFKASLLQSPARRLNSPLKTSSFTPAIKPVKELGQFQSSPKRAALFSPAKSEIISHSDEVSLQKTSATPQSSVETDVEMTDPPDVDESSTPTAQQVLAPTESSSVGTELKGASLSEDGDDESEVEASHLDASPSAANPSLPNLGASTMWRRISGNSQLSEDELASPDKRFAPTPLRRQSMDVDAHDSLGTTAGDASFTPLSDMFSGWMASRPDKQRPSRQQRGIFSLPSGPLPEVPEQQETDLLTEPPAKTSFFEDEIDVLDVEQITPLREQVDQYQHESANLQASMESQASCEYGDENAVPAEAEVLRAEQEANDPTLTCTPAKVFTPAKQISRGPREVCTVSKVPLRASGEMSSFKLPRQRSKSLGGGALAVLAEGSVDDMAFSEEPATPTLSPVKPPQTPSSGMKLDSATPGRTGRKNGASKVLQGAVVYVDVHTSEGADASGIFVDLLTQMGARCVKQWNWNPRASQGDSLGTKGSPQDISPNMSSSFNKVGITHVVYKDGGVRTLEKVRLSEGVVVCVGVGWVLDCEREDAWLDEANYAIDLSLVPRGGHRRRKSMEPKALANLEGSLVLAGNDTPPKAHQMSPTKEFLALNTPASRRDTFVLETEQVTSEEAEQLSMLSSLPATPDRNQGEGSQDGDIMGASPTTPFYLSKGATLIQRTCPPKHKGDRLFPTSGNVEDEPDEEVRRRLVAARRKTLQWSSKTKSPLGRTVSYEI